MDIVQEILEMVDHSQLSPSLTDEQLKEGCALPIADDIDCVPGLVSIFQNLGVALSSSLVEMLVRAV